MALDGTYTGLQASILDWLHRAGDTSLTALLPDLVFLAESRIARDLRVRQQVAFTTISTVAGTPSVSLPGDLLELENVGVSSNPDWNLQYANIEYLNTNFPDNSYTGRPLFYTIEGANLLLGPNPDAVYALSIYYYQKFPALATAGTNWLLLNHPGIYLWACLAESAPYTLEDPRLPMWESKYKSLVEALQKSDDDAMYSGSVLRVRKL